MQVFLELMEVLVVVEELAGHLVMVQVVKLGDLHCKLLVLGILDMGITEDEVLIRMLEANIHQLVAAEQDKLDKIV